MEQPILEALLHEYAVTKVKLIKKTKQYNEYIQGRLNTDEVRTHFAKIELEYDELNTAQQVIAEKLAFIDSGDKFRLIDVLLANDYVATQLSSIHATFEKEDSKFDFDLVSVTVDDGMVFAYNDGKYNVSLEELMQLVLLIDGDDTLVEDIEDCNEEDDSELPTEELAVVGEKIKHTPSDWFIAALVILLLVCAICGTFYPFGVA